MLKLSSCAIITMSIISAPAPAAVYINDAIIENPNNIMLGSFPQLSSNDSVFTLTKSPNGYVVLEIERIGSSLNPYSFQLNNLSIAGNYSMLSVSTGDELTFLNASSKPGGYLITLTNGQSAYIGYWSQRGGKPPSSTPEADDIFGWAKITVTPSLGPGNPARLKVLESVSADGGIIVGTAQQIPEVDSAIITLAGAFLLLRRKRSFLSRKNALGNSHPFIRPGVSSFRRRLFP